MSETGATLIDESRTGRGVAPYAPVVVGVLGAWAMLVATGTPFVPIVVYTAYFALAVVLPGTLIYRRMLGFSESLLSDLAWGSVVGFMVELLGWAIFTVVGINRFLWAWPLLIVALFALVPGLRPMWRRPVDSGRTSLVASWGTAIGALLACAYVAVTYYPYSQLPPNGPGYFVDLPWHLGVAYEATRSVPLMTPEATAEGVLHYHWFADAHFGAASLISGVDLATIVVRTGLFAIIFTLVSTVVALGIKITKRPLVGAIAGILVVSTTAGAEYWYRMFKLHVVFPDSPTGMYAIGISCLFAAFLVELVRGESFSAARWVLFLATAVAAVGSKPSNLLLLLPAFLLVLAYRFVLRNRPSVWQIVAVVAMVVVFGISVLVFASPGGSTLKPSLVQAIAWKRSSSLPALIVTCLMKGYLLLFVAALALVGRRLRNDAAAQFLGAISIVGFGAAWIIFHPGRSQLFFWHSAIPFAGILAAWGLVLALDSLAERRRAVLTFTVLTCGAFLGSMTIVKFVTTRTSPLLYGWLALGVTIAVVALFAWRLRIPTKTAVLLGAVAVMAMSVPSTLIAAPVQPSPWNNPRWPNQARAARWIEANTPLFDTLATNSHCLDHLEHCDARSFWLAGYGGRRVLLEGYGVSPNALRLAGVNDIVAWRQPYHDQDLLKLNDGAFTDPTAPNLRRLYDEYEVRWLVADVGEGTVSPKLADFAELVFSNEQVVVYKLDPATF
ncbi:hypothetical protein F4553_003096 [Allocatelliglobosispora scoriae]|uniref:Uncharacterized protein n=1 Tax=Allocatelliglobosispora scoriae TaxID=643052 RepID=A0A841BKU6_9ACTN|nr:hypothetical protein [Allocatelliglobosispora scoriae]MBB5869717.1 hypothetical protein [Allocatelliglobosispora scoriae]